MLVARRVQMRRQVLFVLAQRVFLFRTFRIAVEAASARAGVAPLRISDERGKELRGVTTSGEKEKEAAADIYVRGGGRPGGDQHGSVDPVSELGSILRGEDGVVSWYLPREFRLV